MGVTACGALTLTFVSSCLQYKDLLDAIREAKDAKRATQGELHGWTYEIKQPRGDFAVTKGDRVIR